jgi:hypothetical protein
MTEQICKETSPVLDIEKIGDEVWVSTCDSSLVSYNMMEVQRKIHGKSRMTQFSVTDNKKFIVTKSSDSSIHIYDILSNKLESSQFDFQETLSKFSSSKTNPSWFSTSLRLGCLALDFNGNDSISANEQRGQEQVFFIEILLKELFSSLISQDSDRSGQFERNFLIIKQHLMEKIEIYWMSRVSQFSRNQIDEVPAWVKEIVPELKKVRKDD